jgi:GT2 family glycosyltransferase
VKSISVVLPNYNGKLLLEKNLPSLIRALEKFTHEIIVVDDASTDQSVHFLTEQYPSVHVVQHQKNQGFSSACNTGIFRAKSDLICVANTDVTFLHDYFEKIVPAINKNVFAAKGRIRNVTSSGEFVNFDTTARSFMKRGLWRFDKTLYEKQLSGFSAELGGRFCLLGCCFVADAGKLKEISGYDEIFSPFYWEDSDLPFRAIRAGCDLRYVPEAEVIHEVSSTINRTRTASHRKLVSNRNKFIFTWRYLRGLKNWLIHIFSLIFFLLVRWLKLDYSYYFGFVSALYRTAVFTRRDYKREAL